MLLDWEEYSPSEYIKPMRSNRATNTDILPLLTRAEIASGLQKDEYLFSSLTNVRSVEAQPGFHHQGLRRSRYGCLRTTAQCIDLCLWAGSLVDFARSSPYPALLKSMQIGSQNP